MSRRQLTIIAFLCISVTLLTACGDSPLQEDDVASNSVPEPIHVAVQITPETPNPGESFTIEATVTQAGESVEDADDVQFELLKDGADDEHEMIAGKHTENGIYTIEKTLDDEGIYYVIAHVTARGMYSMPETKFAVGEVNPPAGDTERREPPNDEVAIHFTTDDTIRVNEQTAIIVHVQRDGAPLTDARVQFEMWKEGSDQRQFFDTAEPTAGVYVANMAFVTPGNYKINAHIRKNTLNEQKEHTIQVISE